MISPTEALLRLREGNQRFVDGDSNVQTTGYASRQDVSGGQRPFAVVLACSDSRVPVEHLFDQSIGDLFVIRVAGNVAAATQIGSIEFAATQLGSRLVVVLGHSNCGAVAATINEFAGGDVIQSPNLRPIIDEIHPALAAFSADDVDVEAPEFIENAVRANVQHSVSQIRNESVDLQNLEADGTLQIVGASYSLETGVIEFLDDAE